MRRRHFITTLGGAIVSVATAPWSARAQQPARKIPRVGYLFSFVQAEGAHLWEACRQGLRELGYVEGTNIVLEPRWAEGRLERLPDLAVELVRLKVDVIVSAATPASLAAKAATTSIPIVFVAVGEPEKTGLVASLARPGGNVTGFSLLTVDISRKRLDLLRDALPNMSSVSVLMNPDNPVSFHILDETQAAARTLGVKLERLEARNTDQITQAFETATATALIVFDDPVIWSHRVQIVELAARRRMPAMYGYRDFVVAGGLMSYGPNRPDHYRHAASYVDKILKGAKPADLPVQQPTKFELVINAKTAKTLGLTIPPTLLAFATEVIE